jgi:hypothetical protein
VCRAIDRDRGDSMRCVGGRCRVVTRVWATHRGFGEIRRSARVIATMCVRERTKKKGGWWWVCDDFCMNTEHGFHTSWR